MNSFIFINGELKITNDLNSEVYQERRDWSWAQVEADFRQAHQALLEAIQQLPPERLRDPIIQRVIARETWEHYAQYLPDLEHWHQQRIAIK